ncbi:MAG: Abi family protein [Bacteroidales bacterium]|nr:Abi family protein [Bacteroidales bacterium]
MRYTQKQLSVDQQLDYLESLGLTIENRETARHTLTHISMSRLKGYMLPFRMKNSKHFKEGITFNNVYNLYIFDSKLRKLLLSQLEKIEVSLRTQMSYVMSDLAGMFWYTNPSVFSSYEKHTKILRTISNELERSDDTLILNFRKKYEDPFPPSLIALEVCSFGTVSLLYDLTKAPHAKRRLAEIYGISDKVFESWMHTLVNLRNICAHHARLWDRRLKIIPAFPKKTAGPFIPQPSDTGKMWTIMSIIVFLLRTINPEASFIKQFRALLKEYPEADVADMGFPANWENEPLWL